MTILDPTPQSPDPRTVEPNDRAARVERLRTAIQVGLDQLERGEVEEVTDISAWLDGLGRRDEG